MSEILNLEINQTQLRVYSEDRYESSTSSKGNQIKWVRDCLWVKADTLGYEGLAECVASQLAHHTNIGDFASITDYTLCKISEGDYGRSIANTYVGCYSENFLKHGETLVTLNRIIEAETGDTFRAFTDKLSTEDRIIRTVELIKKVTGIFNYGEWLTCLLEWDMLIFNEDRHEHNIAFVKNERGEYRLMPLFDNGAGFFSDTRIDYSLDKSITECEKKIKSKPFSTDFHKQVKACRNLYGTQLKLNFDSIENVTLSSNLYDNKIALRILNILKRGMRRIYHV